MLTLLLFVVHLISTTVAEEPTTRPSNLSAELHTERPVEVTTEFPVEVPTELSIGIPTELPIDGLSSVLPFEIDTELPTEWSTEFEERVTPDTSTMVWFDEWPTEWQTLFPFYSNLEDRRTLSERLLSKYNKYILPYSGKIAFNIAINVSLVAVGDIDELEEKLSTVLWLTYKWNDENIKWNQDENYITDVTFGWIDVWKPVLRVDNPHADSSNRQTTDRSFDSVIYNSTGSAWFDEMMVTRTTCDLDMTYYPFDIQTCVIKLSVVGASKFPFNLNIRLNEYLSSSDAKHGSWILIYKNTTTFYGSFEIELKFERRPLFILLNILLPIIVLALLTPFVFILPKKSGERVGFSITMLLAISVYMTIVSDHLPQNSEPMPLVLVMMFTWYIMDAIIVFIVIINTRINTMKNKRPFPNCLLKFVRFTRKVFYRKKEQALETSTTEETQKCIDSDNTDEKEGVNLQRSQGQENDSSKEEDRKDATWQALSHCVDRWCFVICYVIKITLPVVFFSVMKSQSKM